MRTDFCCFTLGLAATVCALAVNDHQQAGIVTQQDIPSISIVPGFPSKVFSSADEPTAVQIVKRSDAARASDACGPTWQKRSDAAVETDAAAQTQQHSDAATQLDRRSDAAAATDVASQLNRRSDAAAATDAATQLNRRSDAAAATDAATELIRRSDAAAATDAASQVDRRSDAAAATDAATQVDRRSDMVAATEAIVLPIPSDTNHKRSEMNQASDARMQQTAMPKRTDVTFATDAPWLPRGIALSSDDFDLPAGRAVADAECSHLPAQRRGPSDFPDSDRTYWIMDGEEGDKDAAEYEGDDDDDDDDREDSGASAISVTYFALALTVLLGAALL